MKLVKCIVKQIHFYQKYLNNFTNIFNRGIRELIVRTKTFLMKNYFQIYLRPSQYILNLILIYQYYSLGLRPHLYLQKLV